MIKIVLIWLLNLFDYIMSYYLIGRYGMGIEKNPLMQHLFEYPVNAFIIKMSICTLTCLVCYFVKDKPIIKVMTNMLLAFYSFVCFTHLLYC